MTLLAPTLLAAALAQAPAPAVTPPRPGEEIRISAGAQRKLEGGWYLFEDYVVIEYEGGRIQADSLQYHRGEGLVIAEGNVVLESGDTVVTGSQIEFDLDEGTGLVHDAMGWTLQDVQFQGKVVEKIGEKKYRLVDGELTACDQPLPLWRVSWSKAIIREGETAQMWNSVVRFKRMPSAYAPYVVFPIKDERTTGFLMPQISSSRRRGFSGSAAFFWAIARNQDALFELDWSDEEVAFAPRYRYVLSERAKGDFEGLWTEIDRDGDRSREIELYFDHDQRFSNGYHWVVDLDYTSSLDFTRNRSTNPDSAVRRTIRSRTFLTRSWGPYSLSYRADDVRWEDRDEYDRRLPEIELVQNSRQLGDTPIYLGFRGSLTRIDTRGTLSAPDAMNISDTTADYERLHIEPDLRVPFSRLPWLDVVTRLSLQGTLWTSHLDPDVAEIRDEIHTREAAQLSLQVAGPRLERFYGLSREPGKKKYQHLIEPTVTWNYAPDLLDEDLAIRFDGIDSRVFRARDPRDPERDIDRNQISFGVRTRLLSKRIAEPGESGESSREILSWDLASNYSVNSFTDVTVGTRRERTRFSNVSSTVWWRPSDAASLRVSNTYDIIVDDITSTRINGNFSFGPETGRRWPWADKDPRTCPNHYCVDFTLNQNRSRLLETTRESVDLRGSLMTPGERFGFSVDLRHDLLNSEIQTQEYVFRYRNQCLGTRVSYFWNRFGERQVLFTLSLRHVGDFFDFRSTQGRDR